MKRTFPNVSPAALIVVAAVVVVLSLSWLAHRMTLGGDADGGLFERTTLTHGQALALASSYGAASHARLERRHGHWVYRVDVLRGGHFIDVEVNPFDGKVVPHFIDEDMPRLPPVVNKLECYNSIDTCF